jgi:Cu/Ag efflux protein CusF
MRYTAIDLQHQKYIVLWMMEMEMEYTIRDDALAASYTELSDITQCYTA